MRAAAAQPRARDARAADEVENDARLRGDSFPRLRLSIEDSGELLSAGRSAPPSAIRAGRNANKMEVMARRAWGVMCGVLVACGSQASSPDASSLDADHTPDAGRSSCVSHPFGSPTSVYGIRVGGYAGRNAFFSDDELAVYFGLTIGNSSDIQRATRADIGAEFGNPTQFLPSGGRVAFTSDSLVMVLEKNGDLLLASRQSATDSWPSPQVIPAASDVTLAEMAPWITNDGLEIYFASLPANGVSDLFKISRTSRSEPFGVRTAVAGISGTTAEAQSYPVLSRDGLELFFARTGQTPNNVVFDLWHAMRASTSEPFGQAEGLFGLDSDGPTVPFWVSPDGCQLFWGDVGGYFYVTTTRPP
jgi:hypothetical protein